jgi:hypothetical protein
VHVHVLKLRPLAGCGPSSCNLVCLLATRYLAWLSRRQGVGPMSATPCTTPCAIHAAGHQLCRTFTHCRVLVNLVVLSDGCGLRCLTMPTALLCACRTRSCWSPTDGLTGKPARVTNWRPAGLVNVASANQTLSQEATQTDAACVAEQFAAVTVMSLPFDAIRWLMPCSG